MNVGTAAGANFLSKAGFKRVVLSRELSLDEMKSVRAETNVELETFVHGALCVSASGVCLFSSYLGGRSANRGACTQACRRLFADESRDGYFFSPDDLQLIEKVPELVEAGLDTFKIEGRMKSSEYVGTVVAAYRYMLDNWRFDRERAASKAAAMLQGDFARHKTTFWFEGTVDRNFVRPDQAGGTGHSSGQGQGRPRVRRQALDARAQFRGRRRGRLDTHTQPRRYRPDHRARPWRDGEARGPVPAGRWRVRPRGRGIPGADQVDVAALQAGAAIGPGQIP